MPQPLDFLIPNSLIWVELILEMTVKTILVLGIAFIILLVGKRVSFATRHLILTLAVVSLLLMPVVSTLLPAWDLPFFPTLIPQASQIYNPGTPDQIVSLSSPAISNTIPPSSLTPAKSSYSKPIDWPLYTLFLWTAGAIIILMRLIAAVLGIKSMIHRAVPVKDLNLHHLLSIHRRQMGIKRKIRLLQTPKAIVPLTCGWIHPTILLPLEASFWPEKRKEIVLLHELAHIKRRDFLLSVLNRIVSILYWFNPLVWVAIKRLAIEREHASDDCVLLAGIKASEYASHLLEIAKRVSNVRWLSPAGITIAKKSNLEARIMSILDNKRPTGQIKLSTLLLIGLLALSLILPVASLKAWAQNERFQEKEQAQTNEMEKTEKGLSAQEKEELKKVLKEFFDYIEKLDFSKAITFFDMPDIDIIEETPLVIIKRGKDAAGKDIVVLDVDDLKKVKVKTDVHMMVKKLQNVAVLGNISVVGTDKDNKKRILIKNDGQIITLKKQDGKWKIIADGRLYLNFIKDDVEKESKTVGLAITDEGVTYTIMYVTPSITVVKAEKKKEEKKVEKKEEKKKID